MWSNSKNYWENNYKFSFPESLTTERLEHITVHKVFQNSDLNTFQFFNELPDYFANHPVRISAIVCENVQVDNNSSVGFDFCQKSERCTILYSSFPPRVYFTQSKFYRVFSASSLTPELLFCASSNKSMKQAIGILYSNANTPMQTKCDSLSSYLRTSTLDDKVLVSSSKKNDGTPKNLIGSYLALENYKHPIYCQKVTCFKEPDGGPGFQLQTEFFEQVLFELRKAIGDPRPLVTLNNFGIHLSHKPRFFSITLSIFYSFDNCE